MKRLACCMSTEVDLQSLNGLLPVAEQDSCLPSLAVAEARFVWTIFRSGHYMHFRSSIGGDDLARDNMLLDLAQTSASIRF